MGLQLHLLCVSQYFPDSRRLRGHLKSIVVASTRGCTTLVEIDDSLSRCDHFRGTTRCTIIGSGIEYRLFARFVMGEQEDKTI